MSRGITGSLQTALEGSSVRPILFVELEFASSTLRLSDQDRNITWNAQTWLGNGFLRPVRAINESADLKGTGCQITLSGVDSATIATVLNDSQQSKKGKIWLGALDASFAVIADPYQVFEGFLDVPEIQDSGKGATLVLNYESDLVILERSSELRFTNETQQIFYAGDKGFEYVVQASQARPFWGKASKPPRTVSNKKPQNNNKGSKGKK